MNNYLFWEKTSEGEYEGLVLTGHKYGGRDGLCI